ncbi:MAG: hypothetical protein H0W56_03810 [Acidothermales bacterium]|nr:hypothetical protein [Acidothermales bacterium]
MDPQTRRVAADIERLADRLRRLSPARLTQPLPPYGTCADAGRLAAQLLADTAQGIEERDGSAAPSWRTVPSLPDHVVGEQVAVTGHDLLAALSGLALDVPVWTRQGRRPATEVLAEAAASLRTLKLAVG